MSLADRLSNALWFRRLVKALRLPDLVTAWLERFPRVVTLPPHGISYRVRAFESLIVEREVFSSDFYADVCQPEAITTFADLGCNRGLFTAWLASHSAVGAGLRGLMADADEAMEEDCRWLLETNRMSGVRFFRGAAGVRSPDGHVEFEIAETDVGSHVAFDGKRAPGESPKTVVRVPVLDVGELWKTFVGPGVRCNLLKVDIEGAERDFFRVEAEFLALVDQILVEVHHYFAPPEGVLADAAAAGFTVRQHKPVADGVSIAHLVRA